MERKYYYNTLELHRKSTTEEIRKAYKKLVLVHHPDKNGGSEESTKKTGEIVEAHEVLVDRRRRAQYDNYLDILAEKDAQESKVTRVVPKPVDGFVDTRILVNCGDVDVSHHRIVQVTGGGDVTVSNSFRVILENVSDVNISHCRIVQVKNCRNIAVLDCQHVTIIGCKGKIIARQVFSLGIKHPEKMKMDIEDCYNVDIRTD